MPARRSPQFEITTAAAFQLFADHPADYLLLEVGLGGRYDATNVVADAARRGDHLDLARPREVPRRHASSRSPARRPASSSAAGRWWSRPQREAALDVIETEAARLGAPALHRQPRLGRPCRARPPGLPGRGRPARPAGAAPGRPPPVHQCRRRRSRPCARPGSRLPIAAIEARARQCRVAGAPAAADQPAGSSPAPAAMPRSGSTAATIRRRRGDRRGHGRPRGARAAAALPDLRHAQHQGPGRLLPALRRPGAQGLHRAGALVACRPRSGRTGRGGAAAPASRPSRSPMSRPRSTVIAADDRRCRCRRASSSAARSISPAPCSPQTARRRAKPSAAHSMPAPSPLRESGGSRSDGNPLANAPSAGPPVKPEDHGRANDAAATPPARRRRRRGTRDGSKMTPTFSPVLAFTSPSSWTTIWPGWVSTYMIVALPSRSRIWTVPPRLARGSPACAEADVLGPDADLERSVLGLGEALPGLDRDRRGRPGGRRVASSPRLCLGFGRDEIHGRRADEGGDELVRRRW